MPVGTPNFLAVAINAESPLGDELGNLIVIALNTANAVRPANRLKECQALLFDSKFVLDRYQALSNP